MQGLLGHLDTPTSPGRRPQPHRVAVAPAASRRRHGQGALMASGRASRPCPDPWEQLLWWKRRSCSLAQQSSLVLISHKPAAAAERQPTT